LKKASFTTELWELVEFQGRHIRAQAQWGIYYAAPGVDYLYYKEPSFSEDVDRRRLVFDVRDWRLSDELYGLFRDIGKDNFGTEMVEKHIDLWETVLKPRILNHPRQ
jgi:hypothetical protein